MVKDYSLFRRADPTSNDNTSLLASAPRVQKNIHRLRVKWDNRDPLFDRTSLFIINPFARVFKMGFASAMIGGGLGVGVQMFSNYTLKIPISRSKFGFPFPVCVCCCCFVLFYFGKLIVCIFMVFKKSNSEPWMHVGLFFIGCYVGHMYPQWEAAMAADVNRLRVANGMPPLVGGNTWLKYQSADK